MKLVVRFSLFVVRNPKAFAFCKRLRIAND